jgi:hypothetical protein
MNLGWLQTIWGYVVGEVKFVSSFEFLFTRQKLVDK